MVAIRSLLPANGYDTSVKMGDKPNYQLNGDQLADIYSQLPDVRKAISRKILNDPTFVRFAIDDVFKRARVVNYVKDGYQSYTGNFTPGQDTYEAAGSVAKSMPPEAINISAIMHDSGRPNLSSDYILSMGGLGALLSRVVNDLLTGIVPRPINEYHRFEKEEDGPVWVKEMEIRVGNMRALIKRMYNVDIYFVENTAKGERGFVQEMTHNPAAQARLPVSNNGVEYVTYNLNEKYQFNHMIFNFLFPQLSASLNGNLQQIDALAQIVLSERDGASSDQNMIVKAMTNIGTWGSAIKALGIFNDIPGKFRMARQDIETAHIVPHENNKFYSVPSLLSKEINASVFKPLMSNQDIEALIKK